MTSQSANNFIYRINKSTDEKIYDISLDEIKTAVAMNSNNFDLLIYVASYLQDLWQISPQDEIVDLAIDYCKKAIVVYQDHNKYDVTKNDIHKEIIMWYVIGERYSEGILYSKSNNVIDNDLLEAELEFKVGNYAKAEEICSNNYLKSIASILNGASTQIRLNAVTNKIDEAYELINWITNFIKSVAKDEDIFIEIIFVLIFIKAACERYLKLDYSDSLQFLKDKYNDTITRDIDTGAIKFYKNKKEPIHIMMKGIKETIDKELKELKDSVIINDMEYIYKIIIGG